MICIYIYNNNNITTYYKQQSENSLFPHIKKVTKNTRIRISIYRIVKYLYVLNIYNDDGIWYGKKKIYIYIYYYYIIITITPLLQTTE